MKKIRIARLTLDGYSNYGNVLQNYALQKVLLGFASNVDYIKHSNENFMPFMWQSNSWSIPIRYVLNWREFRENLNTGKAGFEMVRQGKIKDWCDRYLCTRISSVDLRELASDYDYFIVGSDQVWNPNFSNLKNCFLFFAPPEKRIAYAASISCPDIPKDKLSLYQKGLAEMAFISMREQQGADMVKDISGRDVPVVLDPTLLLSPDDWRKVSRQPAWYHGEEYILTYFLGKRPDAVNKLEHETGLKVVNLLDTNIYEHYVTGPDEFLWAVEHARLMYTDSFHGTVFSILFRTPFVVCDRVGSRVSEKMSSRIDTLLGYFGLEARRGTKENDYVIENPLTEPNWTKVDEVLERERKRSKDYLCEAMGIM